VTGNSRPSDRQVSACSGEWTALPAPRDSGAVALETALRRRRSVREFQVRPLSQEALAQLFWAAQGITHPRGLRTAPSAGALYPLEVYAATERGLLHYQPRGHCVRTVIPSDVRAALQRAAGFQESVGAAGAVFVITAVYQRTAARYGPRTERYVHIEAGHAAQNVLLEATALDLGAVPVGAFDDDQVAGVLGLPQNQRPVYLIPVGVPR
jgi:SagB-type dehydrogenase family enzyme